MQNSNYIHFFFENEIDLFLNSINPSQFKRRYPGKHIAAHISSTKSNNLFFEETLHINIETIQKICFSPILGDEIGIKYLYNAISDILKIDYEVAFNLFGHPTINSLLTLFKYSNARGFNLEPNAISCDDCNLRLLRAINSIPNDSNLLKSSLLQKALKQFNPDVFEENLSATLQHKLNSKLNTSKKLIILNDNDGLNLEDERILSLARSNFLVIDNGSDSNNSLVPDARFGLASNSINISILDIDEVFQKISNSTFNSINNWFVTCILADYLGLNKLSFSIEKMIATYPKDILQEYMISQVSSLREFVSVLIASERNQNPEIAIKALYAKELKLSPLSLSKAIFLSQHPEAINPGALKLENLKSRLRNLKSVYERTFRLCSIDIPKSDLSLTL